MTLKPEIKSFKQIKKKRPININILPINQPDNIFYRKKEVNEISRQYNKLCEKIYKEKIVKNNSKSKKNTVSVINIGTSKILKFGVKTRSNNLSKLKNKDIKSFCNNKETKVVKNTNNSQYKNINTNRIIIFPSTTRAKFGIPNINYCNNIFNKLNIKKTNSFSIKLNDLLNTKTNEYYLKTDDSSSKRNNINKTHLNDSKYSHINIKKMPKILPKNIVIMPSTNKHKNNMVTTIITEPKVNKENSNKDLNYNNTTKQVNNIEFPNYINNSHINVNKDNNVKLSKNGSRIYYNTSLNLFGLIQENTKNYIKEKSLKKSKEKSLEKNNTNIDINSIDYILNVNNKYKDKYTYIDNDTFDDLNSVIRKLEFNSKDIKNDIFSNNNEAYIKYNKKFENIFNNYFKRKKEDYNYNNRILSNRSTYYNK